MIKNEVVLKFLRDEIENLLKINQDLDYIIISTYDGIPIASNVSSGGEESILAAVAAIVRSLSDKVNQMIPAGELKYVLFHYSEKKIIVLTFSEYEISVVAKEAARTGILLRDIISFVEKIKGYLTGLGR